MYGTQAIDRPASGRTRVLFAGELTLPDANKYSVVLDTTNGLPDEHMAAPPKSAALPAPGSNPVGIALGRIYAGAYSCTGQDAAVEEYGLHGDGTWHLLRSVAVQAGAAAQTIVWDPSAYGFADVLIVVKAGAIAPTHVYANITERTLP
jgi:hypothetical protein